MRKIALLLMVCSTSLSFGQTFTLSPDTVEGTYADYEFAYDYIYLDNNSGSALTINFTLLSNTCASNGWYNTLCTSLSCYPNVPSTGTLGSIPDGGQGHFAFQCGFDGIVGDGTMRIRVYESGNPSNADTLTYIYHAYSTAGIENANNNAGINMYPNPAVDIINIQSKEIFTNGYLIIRDISGKIVVQQLFLSNLSSVQISQFEAGVYFATIYSGNQIINAGKFVKE